MAPKKINTLGDEPIMSDSTLLVSVEDLINMAMGPSEKNIVNFKLLQIVLHSLARQMRMLETRVEIRVSEVLPTQQGYSTTSSSSKSPRVVSTKSQMKDIKEEGRKKKSTDKEHGKSEMGLRSGEEKREDTADKSSSKQKDKLDKTQPKRGNTFELEKEDKVTKQEKLEKTTEKGKENEKEEMSTTKEKEKTKKEKTTEKGKEKVAKKEQEKLEKDKGKSRDELNERPKSGKEKITPARAGIAISEVERHKEKVLIVEKGPTSRSDSTTRVGSIEVVTLSQFAMLEAVVKALAAKAEPLPSLALPDNQTLRTELAKGTASLTDTMQAMQVSARVKAAEQAIGRMAGLLTQLAAAGALPEDMVENLGYIKAPGAEDATDLASGTTDLASSIRSRPTSALPRKSVAIDPMSTKSQTSRKSVAVKASVPATRTSIVSAGLSAASRPSSVSNAALPKVTHMDMGDALRALKEELMRNMNNMTNKATTTAEIASNTAQAVSEKIEIALKLSMRITMLNSLVSDYAVQLSGFDAGLTTQMQSFKEQIIQMRCDLAGGIQLLENANTNAETAAVMELTERYEGLVTDLDQTLHSHQGLSNFQKQLGDELRSLVECVEMLREEKADRDEMLDGLRDKADISRLAGLLTEMEFVSARHDLERRLSLCYEKFNRQELVWMGCIKDLTLVLESKAEIMQLLGVKDNAQQQLRELQNKQQRLAVILGEPKAAVLTRKLARDATCGSCMVPALMEPRDVSFGAPAPLPAMRPRPTGAPAEPCLMDWKPPNPPDDRDHTCHRWVGGSHTLVTEAVSREQAPSLQMDTTPVKRYTGVGNDGRTYLMEDELKPCVDCNNSTTDKESKEKPAEAAPLPSDGAGDRGSRKVQTKTVSTVYILPAVNNIPVKDVPKETNVISDQIKPT